MTYSHAFIISHSIYCLQYHCGTYSETFCDLWQRKWTGYLMTVGLGMRCVISGIVLSMRTLYPLSHSRINLKAADLVKTDSKPGIPVQTAHTHTHTEQQHVFILLTTPTH